MPCKDEGTTATRVAVLARVGYRRDRRLCSGVDDEPLRGDRRGRGVPGTVRALEEAHRRTVGEVRRHSQNREERAWSRIRWVVEHPTEEHRPGTDNWSEQTPDDPAATVCSTGSGGELGSRRVAMARRSHGECKR